MPAETVTTRLSDEAIDKALVTAYRDLWGTFAKAVKAAVLYPPENPLPSQFRSQLTDKLTALLKAGDDLVFSFGPHLIRLGPQEVYSEPESKDSFVALFHRDGVHQISFSPGVEAAETAGLIDAVAKALSSHGDGDDLVTLLWQKEFLHIKYQVVEDVAEVAAVELNLGKGSKAESDPLVYVNLVLQEGKAGTGEGSGEGDKAGEGQAAAPPAHAAAVRKVFGDIEQMAQEDRAAIARELSENKVFPWSKEALELLCEMVYLENEPAGVAETVGILEKILDELIAGGRVQPTAQIVTSLRQLLEDFRSKPPEWARPVQAALDKAGDPIRLSRMTELLNANKVDDPEAVAHYLRTLDWKSVGNIHALLGTLEHYPHRKLVCQVLEQMGPPAVELIAKGMADPRWFVVRNTALILGHIGGDKACQHLRAGLSHSDVRVRRETLLALEQIGTPTASKMVLGVLNEKDGKLRSKALQILVHLQEAEACEPLWLRIESKDFLQWSPEEQRELVFAYAQIGRDRVLEELAGLVTRQAFFKRGLYQPIKEFAVEAMAKVGTLRAQEYLERLAGTTHGALKTACQTWAQRLKRRQVQGVVPARTAASRGDEHE